MAFARCAPATLDATLAAGLGMSALALSHVSYVHQLGIAALGAEAAAVVGGLLLLPAIMASPLAGLMGAEAAPSAGAGAIPSVRIAGGAESAGEPRSGRTDVAAAGIPSPTQRARSQPPAGEERLEAAESPHAALQAKLQRLRRAAE
jgi:hypothetical protein